MGLNLPQIAIITQPTRMAGVVSRWATKGQAKFNYLRAKMAAFEQAGDMTAAMAAQARTEDDDFLELEEEDQAYQQAVARVKRELRFDVPVAHFDLKYLNFIDFSACRVVIVVGKDGLVANTAKYVGSTPIVGVNPDPRRIDGVLLPFRLSDARAAVLRVLNNRAAIQDVTLAEARLHDGQRMLAFNDLFVGAKSHTSARYSLTLAGRSETQSSSGLLVSTGAGSTGWMSSVYHMARGVAANLGAEPPPLPPSLPWNGRQLVWAVREPFLSQTSGVEMVAGAIEEGQDLVVESQMSGEGVVFSDGVETDFLQFNGGAILRIGLADQQARLVVNRNLRRRSTQR